MDSCSEKQSQRFLSFIFWKKKIEFLKCEALYMGISYYITNAAEIMVRTRNKIANAEHMWSKFVPMMMKI